MCERDAFRCWAFRAEVAFSREYKIRSMKISPCASNARFAHCSRRMKTFKHGPSSPRPFSREERGNSPENQGGRRPDSKRESVGGGGAGEDPPGRAARRV